MSRISDLLKRMANAILRLEERREAAAAGGAAPPREPPDEEPEESDEEPYEEGDLINPADIPFEDGMSFGKVVGIILLLLAVLAGLLVLPAFVPFLRLPWWLVLSVGGIWGFVVMGFVLGYVPELYFGILLKVGRFDQRIRNAGLHWVVPFFWRMDLISTKERVDKVVKLSVPTKDGFTLDVDLFVRWIASSKVARMMGGLITNIFYRKRATAVRRGMEEALESEATALIGSVTLADFVSQGASVRTIFECYFKLHRKDLPHYDHSFIAREGIWKPVLNAEGTTVTGWRKDVTWPEGEVIPVIARLGFYERNRRVVIERLEAQKHAEAAHEAGVTARSIEESRARYELENGITVHEVGFNFKLSDEAKKTLQAAARTAAATASGQEFEKIDRSAREAALALQGVAEYRVFSHSGLPGADPLGTVAGAAVIGAAIQGRPGQKGGK